MIATLTHTDIAATCWRLSGAHEKGGKQDVADAMERAGYIVMKAERMEKALAEAIALLTEVAEQSALPGNLDLLASDWLELHGKKGK